METKLWQTENDLGELQNSFLELKQKHEREIDALQKAVNELLDNGNQSLSYSASWIVNIIIKLWFYRGGREA